MNWGETIVLLMMLFLVPLPAPSEESGQDIRVVKAKGSATVIGSDVDGARRSAIAEAKRNAVEQIGMQIIGQTLVENFELVRDRIITRIDGYVHSHTILEERRIGSDLVLTIEATVSRSAVADDAVLIYQDMAKPRIMVVLPELQGKDFMPASHSEDLVSQFFVEKGFTVIDRATARAALKDDEMRRIAGGDDREAVKAGLRAGAEVIVVGTASPGEAEPVRGILYASKASISLRALRTDTAALYAVSAKTESAADGIADAVRRKAADGAARSAAKDLFWKIVKKWNDERLAGSDIELILSGVNFSSLKKVTEKIRAVNGVSGVIQRSFDAPIAVLAVTFRGDANRLADILSEISVNGSPCDIRSVTSGKITLHIQGGKP